MASAYQLQIVHKAQGVVVAWEPGLTSERDLVSELCDRVQAKGVGFARTEAHVLADVRSAFEDLLLDIKRRVRPA